MSLRFVICSTLVGGLLAASAAFAQNGTPINPNSNNRLTLAVYGDAPYGLTADDTTQTDKTAAFIAAVNADPKVDLVLHAGDIHSGKQLCTEAYDGTIADLWSAFENPLIYTPGDNEWTDCQKSGEGEHVNGQPVDYAHGDPLANLQLIRTLFFPVPGVSLGGDSRASSRPAPALIRWRATRCRRRLTSRRMHGRITRTTTSRTSTASSCTAAQSRLSGCA